MKSSTSRHFSLFVLIAALAVWPTPARANVNAAARAYTEGQTALLEGKYEAAAKSFELADSIIPTKEALRSAARARMLAGQMARAASLSEALLARYPDDDQSRELATDILNDVKTKLTRFRVHCATDCTVGLQGRALIMEASTDHVFYVEPGTSSIEVSYENGETAIRVVPGKAGEEVALDFDTSRAQKKDATAQKQVDATKQADAPKPAADELPATEHDAAATTDFTAQDPATGVVTEVPPGPSGLPPFVVFIGMGVTAATGGVALWSALDTNAAHEDYAGAPSQGGWDQGRKKQSRTNALWVATGAVGLTTAVLSFFTNWGGGEETLSATIGGDGGSLVYSGSF